MAFIFVEILYGLTTIAVGAAAGWWLCHVHFRRKANEQRSSEGRHAAEVLTRLHDLATRVAVDVGEHSTQVEAINDRLTAAETQPPALIVDVVARLIETNQQIQEKLASTEDKLRDQAQQLQAHVAEARTDALTLLANRRAFDDEIARRIAEFRRQRQGFSLIMADVDRFKKFNDAYGHPAGDEVLRGVARLLRRKMREMDLVARYGGEEFAIILPGTSLSDASRAAQRAREAIEKWQIRHGESELSVTLSLGVAEAQGNEDGAMLLARSDKALYAAKEGGRNCVYRHNGATVERVGADEHPAAAPAKDQPQGCSAAREAKKPEQPGPARDAGARGVKPELPRDLEVDAVSGLPSRTSFCQLVRNRTAEWKRGGPMFSVVLIEVNQYPQGIDECSRRAGDAAAQVAAQFLAATLRDMDIVGHYAPGCLSLLLPTAGLVDALRVGERLRVGFSQYKSAAQGEQPQLTLSVGVVQVMEKDDSSSLLRRAEAALDAADRRGGNRAYYHDGERCAPITAMLETMDYLS